MKRLLALVAGGLGLRALWRRRSRAVDGASPADELRAKLADAKAQDHQPPTVEERRSDVHARARDALDDLRE
jgi:hypothetical protein